jgi:hypothetical protein
MKNNKISNLKYSFFFSRIGLFFNFLFMSKRKKELCRSGIKKWADEFINDLKI